MKFVLALALLVSLAVPAWAAEDETAFLLFGDTGIADKNQFDVAKGMEAFCKKELCQFVTLLGDNFYPSGVTSVKDPQWKSKFHEPYDRLGLMFYAALGNHDYDGGKPDAQVAYTSPSNHWYMPARYYTFTKGEVDFIVIDTNQFNAKQINWLTEQIALSKNRWRVVFGHHPIYSTGSHGDNKLLREKLLPLLLGKVDFYLAGHDHDKQVIRPRDGVQFVVSGAAAQVRPSKKGPNTEFAAHTLGWAHLHFKKETAKLRFFDKNGKQEFAKDFRKD